ncbi:hypothetical protein CPT_Slocum_106 [Serratia phage Slocum]|nr:hypothetical protein CPT_Slocum_106 [Serratia phage Slocum]
MLVRHNNPILLVGYLGIRTQSPLRIYENHSFTGIEPASTLGRLPSPPGMQYPLFGAPCT